MATWKEKRGTGITAIEIEVSDEPMDAEKFGGVFGQRRPTFSGMINDLEEACRTIMADPELFRTVGRRRGLLADDDQVPALAEEVVHLAGKTRGQIEAGNADMTARVAYRLGAQAMALAMKLGREREWLTGHEVHNGAKKGGPKRGKNDRRNMEMAKEFLKRKAESRSKISDSALKKNVGSDYGLKSRSGSIEAVDEGLKKLSG